MKIKQLFIQSMMITSLILGQVAVMARPLAVEAQNSPDWDQSSLSFTGSCSLTCQHQLSATVCNVGSQDMDGPVAWELYFASSGNPKNGTIIATGEVPAMASTDPDSCFTITHNASQAGNYMFRALQRPGHPGQGELWSTNCDNGCTSPVPSPSPSPSPSISPSPSVSPSPSASASASPSPSPSPIVIVLSDPTASPSASPLASANPSSSPSPTPIVTASPSPNNESNGSSSNSSSNSSNDPGNGTGGGNSSSNSSDSKPSKRGTGQVLGATTLAATGNSDIILAMILLFSGVILTLSGTVYAYKVS